MYDSDTLIGFLVVMSASPCLGSAGNIPNISVACPHPHRLEWLAPNCLEGMNGCLLQNGLAQYTVRELWEYSLWFLELSLGEWLPPLVRMKGFLWLGGCGSTLQESQEHTPTS